MSKVRLTLHGESWIRLEAVAEVYACDRELMAAAFEQGLLGPGQRVDRVLFVRTAVLDRAATIVRMHVHQGLELAAVAVLLDED